MPSRNASENKIYEIWIRPEGAGESIRIASYPNIKNEAGKSMALGLAEFVSKWDKHKIEIYNGEVFKARFLKGKRIG